MTANALNARHWSGIITFQILREYSLNPIQNLYFQLIMNVRLGESGTTSPFHNLPDPLRVLFLLTMRT